MRENIVKKIVGEELRPFRATLAFIVLLTFVGAGLEALSPWPFKYLIDHVLGTAPLEGWLFTEGILRVFTSRLNLGFFVVFIFFALSLGSILIDYLVSYATRHMVNQIEFRLSRRAFASIERMSMGFYKYREVGDYLYRLEDDVGAVSAIVRDGLLPITTSVFYICLTAGIMFSISVPLTLVSLAVVPVLAFAVARFNSTIVRATRLSERRGSALYSFIEQALSQLRVIQIFSQERATTRRYTHRLDSTLTAEFKAFRLNLLLTACSGLVIAVCYGLIILFGIQAVFLGTLTTGLLIVFIFYLDYLTTPVVNLIEGITTLREEWVRLGRMKEFFETKYLVRDTGRLMTLANTTITFDRVSLVSKEQREILHPTTFSIASGERVAIVGKSGAGKTTLISLIPRLEEPTHGRILLGDRDIREYSLDFLRSMISIVPQEAVLFDDTIRSIIAFGDPHCSFKDIQHAARLAGAHAFIERLPGTYEFRVGQRGNLLSGGQRQRLMMARAFVKRTAKIFIFDEPTSALDTHTKEAVLKTLYRVTKEKTTIIVAHRPKTIMDADRIIVLDHGRLVDSGIHGELLKRCAVYQELFLELTKY